MSGRILTFTPPSNQARTVPALAGAPAAVVPFPSARHVRHLPNVVARMRECSDFDGAKDHLTWHVDMWWDRLLTLGVSDRDAESDCRAFVAAALEQYSRDDEQGAA